MLDVLVQGCGRPQSLNCPLVLPESDSHSGLSLGLGLKPHPPGHLACHTDTLGATGEDRPSRDHVAHCGWRRTENACIAKAPLISCTSTTSTVRSPKNLATRGGPTPARNLGFPLDHMLAFLLIVLGGSRLPLLTLWRV